jgi:hypothetical protein
MERRQKLTPGIDATGWLRVGIAAFAVVVIARVLRTAEVVHGHTWMDLAEGVEIVALVVGIAALLRYAIVREK